MVQTYFTSLYPSFYPIRKDPHAAVMNTTSNNQTTNHNAVKYKTIMEIVTREKKKERSEVFIIW